MAKKPKKKLTPYNRHVQREMKAGRSMKQAAASWSKKSGKPKAKTKSRSPSSKPKGGKSTMGKKGFNTQKIFKYMRIGALALPAVERALGPGTPMQKVNLIKRDYFGIGTNGLFYPHLMARGWLPFVAATVATYGIPKLAGLIRGFGK